MNPTSAEVLTLCTHVLPAGWYRPEAWHCRGRRPAIRRAGGHASRDDGGAGLRRSEVHGGHDAEGGETT